MQIHPKNVGWAIATLLITLSSAITFTPLDSFPVAAQSISDQKAADQLFKEGKQQIRAGQYWSAIDLLNQALFRFKRLKKREQAAETLNLLGSVYGVLSEYSRGINAAQQALLIYRETGNQKGEANALRSLGGLYGDLSQYDQAIEFMQQALLIYRGIGSRPEQSYVLRGLGYIYNHLSQPDQAIVFLQQALVIERELKNHVGEAYTLMVLGMAYDSKSQQDKAIELYQQSLVLFRQVGNRLGESSLLNSLGTVYANLTKYDKALKYYQQALPIYQEVGDRHGRGVAFSNIGELLEKQNQRELAVVFYKQAIKVWESIRVNLHNLPKELQESYVQSVADTYRALADLLLKQGRILEAQQVLELLKVQEIREFTRDARFGEQTAGLAITPAEQKILDQHGTLIAFSQKVYDCKKDEQRPCAELGQLNQQLYILNQQYTQAVQSFEREIRDRKDPEMVDPGKLLAEAKPIVEAEPGTLLVYPLVLEDKTWLLWVARGGVVKSVEIPISRQQLGEAVVNFRNLVQDRRSTAKQVQAAGKRLYDILFKSGAIPLEIEMHKNQIRYLVFALDRVTRYIPMAALYDGQHYLSEKYTVSTVISAGLTNVDRLSSNPKNNPVLALGVSESVEDLTPLENVPQELNAIVQQSPTDTGIYPGQEFLNRDFNQQTLLTHLLGHKFLHIATHAAFLPNNPENSFILMGTGKLTIPQIRSLPDLASVRMVVLSACETALGGPDQDGIEISGISSYFLNSGVETVVASLWAVNDASTSALMQQFYQNLATGTMTKAEALRQAQLSLLRRKGRSNSAFSRSDVEVREEAGARAIAGQSSDFSHPYYWAPFILIGNGL